MSLRESRRADAEHETYRTLLDEMDAEIDDELSRRIANGLLSPMEEPEP